MQTSPLLKLPAELRNLIWEYALHSQEPVMIYRHLSAEAPLLLTCKKIRNEGLLLFYATNDFSTTTRLLTWHHLAHWLRHGPKEKLSLVKSLTVQVTLPGLDPTWPAPPRPSPPRLTTPEAIKKRRFATGTFLEAFHEIDFCGRELASVVRISANDGVDTERYFGVLQPSRTNCWSRLLLLYLVFGLGALDEAWAEPTSSGFRAEWMKMDERLEEIVRKRAS